jgi:hypothetical protein
MRSTLPNSVKAYLALLLIAAVACPIGCQSGAQNRQPTGKLAKVRTIALVSFLAIPETNPEHPIHRILIDAMFKEFQSKISSNTDVVRFVPTERVIRDKAYRQVAKIKLPNGAVSPVDGLSYISIGTEGGFDAAPLVSSLGADALMVVAAKFGVDIRDYCAAPYLTADVRVAVVVSPEEIVWDRFLVPMSFSEPVPATIFNHFSLTLPILARCVFFLSPTKEESAELMDIEAQSQPQIAKDASDKVFDDLVTAVKEGQ